MSFEPIEKFEPLTKDTVEMLRRNIGFPALMVIDLGDVDLKKGAGVISSTQKCVWTKQGHRITIGVLPGPGLIASQSKEPDPIWAEGGAT
jgi:hypothetical protein